MHVCPRPGRRWCLSLRQPGTQRSQPRTALCSGCDRWYGLTQCPPPLGAVLARVDADCVGENAFPLPRCPRPARQLRLVALLGPVNILSGRAVLDCLDQLAAAATSGDLPYAASDVVVFASLHALPWVRNPR